MNLERAKQIDGWMSNRELEWLANRASESFSILEIGSYKGRSTRALCDNTKGLVEIVDSFHGKYYSNDFKSIIFEADDALFDQFLKNIMDLNNIVIWKQPFRTFLSDNKKYDFIFIDGDHHFNEVKHDIEKGIKLLKNNSFLNSIKVYINDKNFVYLDKNYSFEEFLDDYSFSNIIKNIKKEVPSKKDIVNDIILATIDSTSVDEIMKNLKLKYK